MAKKTKKETSFDKDMSSNESFSESYLSIGLGLLVVVVVGVLLFNFFSKKNKSSIGENGEETTQKEATNSGQPGETHTISEGETLWDISEEYYGDGFQWEKIADANSITNPNNIETDQKIEIPKTDEKTEAVDILPETGIVGNIYEVKTGDTLWSIACEVYADDLNGCYRWPEIAELNGILNPELITEGDELLLL